MPMDVPSYELIQDMESTIYSIALLLTYPIMPRFVYLAMQITSINAGFGKNKAVGTMKAGMVDLF